MRNEILVDLYIKLEALSYYLILFVVCSNLNLIEQKNKYFERFGFE